MEWTDLARIADTGGPLAQLLVLATIVAGIAAWVGRRADADAKNAAARSEADSRRATEQLNFLGRINRQLTKQLEDALQDAAQARADAVVARAEAQRATEDAETSRFELAQARAMLADATLRADTAQKVAREIEEASGVPHRRASDRSHGD